MHNEYLVYAWQVQSSKQANSVSVVGIGQTPNKQYQSRVWNLINASNLKLKHQSTNKSFQYKYPLSSSTLMHTYLNKE